MKFKPLLGVLCTAALLTIPTASVFASNADSQDMYRLYNPNSGEHFYTANSGEKDNLVKAGWNYEGIGWTAPTEFSSITDTQPVYRLYNPNAGDHFYTLSSDERWKLIADGWNDEGIGWYSAKDQEVPLFREYNPNCIGAGSHNFTPSQTENNNLVNAGWKAEGTAWYGISPASAKEDPAVVTEQGWSVVSSAYSTEVSVGAKIKNPNPSQNISYATVHITSYRADGSIVDAKTEYLNIPANTTIAYGDTFSSSNREHPDHVTVTVDSKDFTSSNSSMIYPADYTISNVSDSVPYTNELKITGVVTNNSDKDTTSATLCVLFYNNGTLVGGDRHYLNDTLSAHSSSNFDKTFSYVPAYTTRDLSITD